MTTRLLVSLGALSLASCVSRDDKASDLEWRRLNEPLRQEDKQKAEFAARYKSYRCEEADVPAVEESSGPGSKFRSMQFGDHLMLKLKLGKLIHVNGTENGGPMRTESRYELYCDDKLVAKAESLFSREHESYAERADITFGYDPASQCLLVYEAFEGTTRYIAFEQAVASNTPSNWIAKHFELPARAIYGGSAIERGRFRGFGNGKVYLEIDGLLYAFPFDDFLVTKLEFTVG